MKGDPWSARADVIRFKDKLTRLARAQQRDGPRPACENPWSLIG